MIAIAAIVALCSLLKTAFGEELLPHQRITQVDSRAILNLFRRQSCSSQGYAACGDSCMPRDASCCDSSGSFCRSGLRCDRGGCCPIGKSCSGPGGTVNVDLTLTSTRSSPTSSSHYIYSSSSRYYDGSGSYRYPASTRTYGDYDSSRYATTTYHRTSTYSIKPEVNTITCPSNRQACRNQCIFTTFNCCPDNIRYCQANEECYLQDQFSYGCTTRAAAAVAGSTSSGLGVVQTAGVGEAILAGAMAMGIALL